MTCKIDNDTDPDYYANNKQFWLLVMTMVGGFGRG